MERECPVCKGSGKADEKYSREVHFGDGVYESKCWMCGGKGTIMEAPSPRHTHLKKYWTVEV